jgi:hypothetical protein
MHAQNSIRHYGNDKTQWKTSGVGETSGVGKACGVGETSGVGKTSGVGETSGVGMTSGVGETSGVGMTSGVGETSGVGKTCGVGETRGVGKTSGVGSHLPHFPELFSHLPHILGITSHHYLKTTSFLHLTPLIQTSHYFRQPCRYGTQKVHQLQVVCVIRLVPIVNMCGLGMILLEKNSLKIIVILYSIRSVR